MSESQEEPAEAPVEALTVNRQPFGKLIRLEDATDDDLLAIEAAIMMGDYSKLPIVQRLLLVQRKCKEENISILQRPYMWGKAKDGKMMLVSTKDRASQLRANKGISCAIKEQKLQIEAGVYIVHVTARTPENREDEDIGVVPVVNVEGNLYPPAELSNAMMTAITKAKNRVTYSLAGVSGTDETEVATIPGAKLIEGAGADPSTPAGQIAAAKATGAPRLVDPGAGKVQMGDLAAAQATRAEAKLAKLAEAMPLPAGPRPAGQPKVASRPPAGPVAVSAPKPAAPAPRAVAGAGASAPKAPVAAPIRVPTGGGRKTPKAKG